MKFTRALNAQNLYRMTKFNWFAHTKRRLVISPAEANVASRGFPIVEATDIIKPPPPPECDPSLLEGIIPPEPIKYNPTHPDWKEIPCLKYDSNDLLVLGLSQAQVVTKTLFIKNALPDKIEALAENPSENIQNLLERIVYTSNIFDAIQVKLPKRKDPKRPAWVFPRDYGIPDVRKSRNMVVSMLHLCELLSGPSISQQRQIIQNGLIKAFIEKDDEVVMFNSTIDFMIMAKNSLTPIDNPENFSEIALPDLYPLNSLAGLQKEHIYQINDLYPVAAESPFRNIHTIFVYHDVEKVKNLSELPVTQHQIEGRLLMKSFLAAVANAKQKYGGRVKDLSEPITIQCIHINRGSFSFSVFQLNTMDIHGTNDKCNYWWSTPQINLFEKALYENGIPIMTGFNPDVFKYFLAFYKNM
ncbi:39S ribosomal protein L37, mitochondrial [Chelonus insularis]|uniref:39S ribosomal protein L37, mitochondrial n=1 Tax=Chelonus insularis TaxID=460826 RepID=UPI00158E55B8|nr:39S ribosomal protein L37, mitochondrial [Chelonus insularis]